MARLDKLIEQQLNNSIFSDYEEEIDRAVRRNIKNKVGDFTAPAMSIIDTAVFYARAANVPDSVVEIIRNADVDCDTNSLSVFISFEDTERDSLYRDGYPDSINILALYDNGFDAKDRVYGKDGLFGDNYPSRQHLDAGGFIDRAIEKFNSEQSGRETTVIVDDIYTKR